MMYSDYVKQRILLYRRLGKSYVQISRCLFEEGYTTTNTGVVRIQAYKFKPTGVYACGYGCTDKYSRVTWLN